MNDLLLIGCGALIAGGVGLLADRVRMRWQRQAAEGARRRELVEQRLPDAVRLQAAVQWLDHDIDLQLGNVRHDNPYPHPGKGVKVPGQWYESVLLLNHNPAMTSRVREAAKGIVDEIERWHAVVDDLEIGKDSSESLISLAKELIRALQEAAGSSKKRRNRGRVRRPVLLDRLRSHQKVIKRIGKGAKQRSSALISIT